MRQNITALAIDDEIDHLDAIYNAAISANILCKKIHYPHDLTEELKSDSDNQTIRLVICDLHLSAEGASASDSSIFSQVAGLLESIGIIPWSPYIMLLWTKDAKDTEKLNRLKEYLEKRLSPEYLPCALIPLDKLNYGIPNPTSEQKQTLWKDLSAELQKSRGLQVLRQLEVELQSAVGNVACALLRTVRQGNLSKKITVDDEIDSLLSRIAREATSKGFANDFPRNALLEGLIPVISDELQHLDAKIVNVEIWKSGLKNTEKSVKQQPLTLEQAASLNEALHISRDGSVNRSDRGSVFEIDDAFVLKFFGINKNEYSDTFAVLGKWPDTARLLLTQIEGICDAAQRKKGVIPLVFTAELSENVKLKEKSGEGHKARPLSIEESPLFLENAERKAVRIVANVRYFIAIERVELDGLKIVYRLRESLVAKFAFAWATHNIRPGLIAFSHEVVKNEATEEIIPTETSSLYDNDVIEEKNVLAKAFLLLKKMFSS